MTDKKVSELSAITAVDDADFLPIVDDSETTEKNKKVTVGQLKTHIAAASSGVGGTMDNHIIPDANAVHDIGSAEFKVRHLYLSQNSLYMGPDGVPVEQLAKMGTVTDANGHNRVSLSSDFAVEAADGDDTLRGLVLKSPDGSMWRVTVSDDGSLSSTKL